MNNIAIYIYDNPREAFWQLGDLTSFQGKISLVGWKENPKQHELPIPEKVSRILSRALASISCLTFGCEEFNHKTQDIWTSFGNYSLRSLGKGSFLAQLYSRCRKIPANIVLMATQNPQIATRLFDVAYFPWQLQAQIVLLSSKNSLPTTHIDRNTFLSLLSNDWALEVSKFSKYGIIGAMRPGVDGAVVGILSLTDEFKELLLSSLKKEVEFAGCNWIKCSDEYEFLECLSDR